MEGAVVGKPVDCSEVDDPAVLRGRRRQPLLLAPLVAAALLILSTLAFSTRSFGVALASDRFSTTVTGMAPTPDLTSADSSARPDASARVTATLAGRPPPLPQEAPGAGRVPVLRMPWTGPVVRGFDARAGPYGAGHRGIDIAAPVGAWLSAPAVGVVQFAGSVAGTTWLSLLVAPGVVVTIGPFLDVDPAAAVGRRVRVHQRMGRLAPGHGREATSGWAGTGLEAALHLSLRVDGVYMDPLGQLIDRPRARLAPLPEPGGRTRG
jgi:hypothetical protein